MALSKLPQIRSDGVGYIDNRSLYFNKYQYRARVYHEGIYLSAWDDYTKEQIVNRIKKNKHRFKNAEADIIINFTQWRKSHSKGKNRTCTVRVEGDVASVFSNDLSELKTLESLGCQIDYTEIFDNIPEGTKYFTKEPKYKYRIYLKSKRVPEEFRQKLDSFINRYKGTDTKLEASVALNGWLKHDLPTWAVWRRLYSSSHFFINYNDESFITLFGLSFGGMISRKFKLEKRPETT